MPSLSHLARDAARRFEDAGIPPAESRLDAVLLARHVLGWDLATWIVHDAAEAPDDFSLRFGALTARRTAREPMAYVLGHAEFWGLDFEVTPAALVPRPETEFVVEEVLARVGHGESWRVADVGTGSGCLAVSIAHERPAARVVATDVSTDALALAARNAAAHAVGARIDFVACSLLDGVAGPFDLIASNPPYLRDGDGPALQPEVGRFEPPVALYGGEDGLGVIRALVAQAGTRLKPRGWLIFEFGFGQDEAVGRLLRGETWTDVGIRNDLQGIPRTAVARRAVAK